MWHSFTNLLLWRAWNRPRSQTMINQWEGTWGIKAKMTFILTFISQTHFLSIFYPFSTQGLHLVIYALQFSIFLATCPLHCHFREPILFMKMISLVFPVGIHWFVMWYLRKIPSMSFEFMFDISSQCSWLTTICDHRYKNFMFKKLLYSYWRCLLVSGRLPILV